MSNHSFGDENAIRSYLKIMVELHIRHELISEACNGQLGLSPPYAREYCYFQFRRMCELLALGCLILHGDIEKTRTSSARSIWNAEKMMNLLDQLHPHFFPQSVNLEKEDGRTAIRANSKPDALTKTEFKKLYAECGQILHRGTVSSFELDEDISEKDYERVVLWHTKIVRLMETQLIVPSSANGFYLFSYISKEEGPMCSLLEQDPADKSILRMSKYKISLNPGSE